MTAFDKKVNQIAARHGWNIEKQARAAVPCYIIAAPTYEDAGKIVAVLNPSTELPAGGFLFLTIRKFVFLSGSEVSRKPFILHAHKFASFSTL